MKNRNLITALWLAISPNLWAQTEANVLANELEISGMNGIHEYQLRLQLPDKQIKTLTLSPAESVRFTDTDFAMVGFADGLYKYELFPIKATKQKRLSNEKQAEANQPSKLSGTFNVFNGLTSNDQDEVDFNEGDNNTTVRAPVITGDQSIRNSLCVGFDCIDNEIYGFDTIRLKENNLRIKFDDTSAAAGFAANDWELTANGQNSGDPSYFSITDSTAANRPFTVEAGAGADALYVENGGQIGIGTSQPAVEIHVVDGDTPTFRLDQGPDGGFAPQIWDVAGNESNFFIRDVTNASALPFRIKPGAPSNSLYVTADGDIGVGTSAPSKRFHMRTEAGSVGFILDKGATNEQWKFVSRGDDFQISKVGTGTVQLEVTDAGAFNIIDNLVMDSNGNVTIQGVLSQNSDVNVKENIQLVNTAEVLDKVMGLPISVWNYKFDDESIKHLGPMAQDFFKQFNLGATDDKITTIDTSGVALASIKELGKKLSEKDQEVQSLQAQNQQLSQRMAVLEEAIKSLKQ